MIRLGGACALVIAGAIARVAIAAPAPIEPIAIEYVAPAACPDEISLRADVIARLGQDPFRGDARRHAFIDVTQTAAGYVAAIELREPGQPPSRRAVGPAQRCDDAVESLALALTVIIDPTSGGTPASPPPSRISEPVRPPSAVGPVGYEPPGWRTPPAPPGPAIHELAFAIGAISGAHPQNMTYAGVRAGYLFDPAWSLGLIARFGRTRGDLDPMRTYDTSSVEVIAEGCARRWLAIGCVLGGIGSKSVQIQRDDGMFVVTTVADYSRPYGILGLGLSIDMPLGRVFLRPSIDLVLPLPTIQIESEGREQWNLPSVQLAFDLAIGGRW